MIRKEIQDDLAALVDRLRIDDPAERAVRSVLSALLAAIGVNQEVPLMIYVSVFTERLRRALRTNMARRN